MIKKEIVKDIVDEFLADSGNYLVDIQVKSDNTIVVEIDSDGAVFIDDCICLSKFIESKLDRGVEDYELEVGSAGIGQPFKILRQYLKNVGNEVEVLTKTGVKHTGVLKAADAEVFVLTVEKQVKPDGAKRKVTVEEDLTFLYSEIKHTKYLIRFK
ncbi:MAG: ribosome assembly cofactor RimP [Dysgonamonadaceae bacterium]|nr:ribosome assembly cofactor RimP [Dysgonamonadaceae bacterium]